MIPRPHIRLVRTLSAEERTACWEAIHGAACCDACSQGNTADCDVNPLRRRLPTPSQAIDFLRMTGEIP